jgi:hypothetical protein
VALGGRKGARDEEERGFKGLTLHLRKEGRKRPSVTRERETWAREGFAMKKYL